MKIQFCRNEDLAWIKKSFEKVGFALKTHFSKATGTRSHSLMFFIDGTLRLSVTSVCNWPVVNKIYRFPIYQKKLISKLVRISKTKYERKIFLNILKFVCLGKECLETISLNNKISKLLDLRRWIIERLLERCIF